MFREPIIADDFPAERAGWHWSKKDDPFDMAAGQQAQSRRTLDSLVGA